LAATEVDFAVRKGPSDSLPDGLLAPQAWPAGTGKVELVETHISWVFLAGDLAYKIKKPVKLDFLDFSTLALRRHFCEEELRINRRFAPALYLGLSQVVKTPQGLAVDRPGSFMEPAVRMRRFDRAQELDALLAREAVPRRMMDDFGARLAAQHDAAPVAAPGQAQADPSNTLAALRENFAVLRRFGTPGLDARVAALKSWAEASFDRLSRRLLARLTAGRFRECHGDLHCANVVRHDESLWAFDALEFDPALRWIDVANDLAFLYMDLRARGHDDLASAFLDGWLAASGDFDALAALRLYESYRACVRAKVAAIRLSQSGNGRDALSRELERYLGAAERAMRPPRPLLVVTTGLSGSGKSWLASRLLAPLDAVRVRSDVERKRLCGLAPGDASGGSIYSPEITRQTYARLAELAGTALADGFSVFVDAACLLRTERDDFRRLAAAAGAPFRLLCVEASDATLRSRVAGRALAGTDPSEATGPVLAQQLSFRQPLAGSELDGAVTVDTDRPIDLAALAGALRDDDRRPRRPPA
jgi:hypothetical protein